MKTILQDLIENSDLETVRMLNVACGPSREIRELLSIPDLSSRKKMIFTGLDNDEESLKFSQSKFKDLPSNIQVRLLNENVLNIFRDKKIEGQTPILVDTSRALWQYFLMLRIARLVVPDYPHHITQRGNYRQDV
jgi:hypothetical protein